MFTNPSLVGNTSRFQNSYSIYGHSNIPILEFKIAESVSLTRTAFEGVRRVHRWVLAPGTGVGRSEDLGQVREWEGCGLRGGGGVGAGRALLRGEVVKFRVRGWFGASAGKIGLLMVLWLGLD